MRDMKGSLPKYADIQPDFSRGVNVARERRMALSALKILKSVCQICQIGNLPDESFPLFEKSSGRFGNPEGGDGSRGLVMKWNTGVGKLNLVLDLFIRLGFSKCHVESKPGDNRVPGFVFRNSASFDRAPEVDNFFFRHTFEKIQITLFI
jgi:hypothetical protein